MGTDVSVTLAADSALVLFEWVSRFNRTEGAAFDDQAEQRALWDLEAVLEATLSEPLRGDYRELLEAARNRVRDPTN